MKNLTLILSTVVDWFVVFCAFLDNIFTMFSPEILASFPAQYIYVISADILALFHPAAESTALPVIFRAGCSPTVEEKKRLLSHRQRRQQPNP